MYSDVVNYKSFQNEGRLYTRFLTDEQVVDMDSRNGVIIVPTIDVVIIVSKMINHE